MMATSTGERDTGMFEMSFRDERILPFEFAGAVSRWRLELPPEHNEIDLDSVSDVVMHLNYTARDGGPVLREAAQRSVRRLLPDSGVRVFDLRREMPEMWAQLTADEPATWLDLRLSRDQFAYVHGNREVVVRRLEVLVEACGARPGAHREAEFQIEKWADCCGPDVDLTFTMVSASPTCGLFHGAVDLEAGPIGDTEPRLLGAFDFEEPLCDVRRLYLVVHYDLVGRHG